ncbi:hypothetical protein [Marinobacter sp.]|uniref:arsenate reductase/protein-tyrosine-phosphatase family protein n=1 Tax=Marinobacter sp. TaxID=50741 RepID=UPI0035C70F59|nr:hypothetical protein [Pseudomonadales bacterium]
MIQLVYTRFGSKNGLLRLLLYRLLSKLGIYSRLQVSLPADNQRLVFVCSGNICRSPLAEVYARSLGREARSCGLDCSDGNPADPRARALAKKRGLTLDHHKTVNVKNFEFRDNDLVVLMEPRHIREFQRKVGKDFSLALAGAYCEKPTPYIHDPFNCSLEFFENCERTIMNAVNSLCDQQVKAK